MTTQFHPRNISHACDSSHACPSIRRFDFRTVSPAALEFPSSAQMKPTQRTPMAIVLNQMSMRTARECHVQATADNAGSAETGTVPT